MRTIEIPASACVADLIESQKRWLGLKPLKEVDLYFESVDEPCRILMDGKPIIYYDFADWDTSQLLEHVQRINFKKSERAGGLKTLSRTFGYKPRYALRSDFCCSTSFSVEQPQEHQVVCNAGIEMSRIYERENPELYRTHLDLTKRINPDFLIKNTVYTSGIVNKNNPLFYHFDTGNFKHVWSGMIVFRKDVEGGDLKIQGLGLSFKLRDKTVIFFDGQSLLHGVTPIQTLTQFAYRYSMVYYSMEQMCKCLSKEGELQRVQQAIMVKAQKRMQKIKEFRENIKSKQE